MFFNMEYKTNVLLRLFADIFVIWTGRTQIIGDKTHLNFKVFFRISFRNVQPLYFRIFTWKLVHSKIHSCLFGKVIFEKIWLSFIALFGYILNDNGWRMEIPEFITPVLVYLKRSVEGLNVPVVLRGLFRRLFIGHSKHFCIIPERTGQTTMYW